MNPETKSNPENSDDRSKVPESAYKDGHLTISGWLMIVESCPRSQQKFLSQAQTPQIVDYCKELLLQWKGLGFPSLGAWPPDDFELFGFALGALSAVVSKKGEILRGRCHFFPL